MDVTALSGRYNNVKTDIKFENGGRKSTISNGNTEFIFNVTYI